MTQYFLNPYCSHDNVKVELDLANYATKSDIQERATVVGTSAFVKKCYLISLNSDVNKLNIDE